MVESILRQIDTPKFGEIRERHRLDSFAKYLDLATWIPINLQRARDLGLHERPPQLVLDLGSGPGYFLDVCRRLGHGAVGIDHPARSSMYRDITEYLRVPVIDSAIGPGVPLPLNDAPLFDVITAFMVTFNGHNVTPWGVPEWEFLIADLDQHLAPGGTIWLQLNEEHATRSCYTPELEAWFRARGDVDGPRVKI